MLLSSTDVWGSGEADKWFMVTDGIQPVIVYDRNITEYEYIMCSKQKTIYRYKQETHFFRKLARIIHRASD